MAELILKGDSLNKGRGKLNNAIEQSEQALNNSKQAIDTANQALTNSGSTQEQLNTVVIEGDSSVEAAQARVNVDGSITYSTLKERLDTENIQVKMSLEEKAKIILSENEPADAEDNAFWYEDMGEAPINFNTDSGISVANATISDIEPSDTNTIWFDLEG